MMRTALDDTALSADDRRSPDVDSILPLVLDCKAKQLHTWLPSHCQLPGLDNIDIAGAETECSACSKCWLACTSLQLLFRNEISLGVKLSV